jgi:hypothetical protein
MPATCFLTRHPQSKTVRWSSIGHGFERLLAANMPPDNMISLGLASERSPANQWRRDSVFSPEQPRGENFQIGSFRRTENR